MKQYSKPIISIDNGMAEGIYTASGDTTTNNINIQYLRNDGDWGNGGTNVYSVDLSNLNPSQLTVILTFNMDISGGWGGGASASTSGHSLTLNWYNAPSSAEISVQVQGADIKQLQCTGYSYTNAN